MTYFVLGLILGTLVCVTLLGKYVIFVADLASRLTGGMEDIEGVNDFIKAITKAHPDINCYALYELLKEEYPHAVDYTDGDHAYTMIHGALWDKRGMRVYPLRNEKNIRNTLKRVLRG